MNSWIGEFSIAVGLLGLLFVAFWTGRRLGRADDSDQTHLGVIQGASLGILGLLIGFSFSGAMGRFGDRREVLVREANAVSTAWMRTDLLPPDARGRLRGEMVEYARARLSLFEAAGADVGERAEAAVAVVQDRLWRDACVCVGESESLRQMILPPLNEAFDLRSERNAAARSHIPGAVVAALILSAILSTAMISYGQSRRRAPVLFPAVGLVLLIGTVIWITIDLDFPRSGLVQVSDQPLRELLTQMTTPGPG